MADDILKETLPTEGNENLFMQTAPDNFFPHNLRTKALQ